jgi:uncharacterized protein YbaR (Trm112 family)
MVDKELLEILVCPKCKSDIQYLPDEDLIVCQSPECGLRYPVRDDIPIMLIDEAEDPKAAKKADSDEGP